MKDAVNQARLQMFDQRLPVIHRRKQEIKHVIALIAIRRNHWKPHGMLR
jgi:hypothetical protein